MTVLDQFMGTGDSLMASINFHKSFVGIEIDKQRCDHAIERIQKRKEHLAKNASRRNLFANLLRNRLYFDAENEPNTEST